MDFDVEVEEAYKALALYREQIKKLYPIIVKPTTQTRKNLFFHKPTINNPH